MVQMANRIEHHTANSDQTLSRKETSPNPKSLQATLRNDNQIVSFNYNLLTAIEF